MPGAGARRPGRCVVIGAGVLGVCVAARLAEAGATVALLEQARPGHGATRASFAWLNANEKVPRGYHDLNHAGMRAWAGLSATLGGAAWYRPAGNIEWADRAPGRADAQAHRLGVPSAPGGRRGGGGPGAVTAAAGAGPRRGGRVVSQRGIPAHRATGQSAGRAGGSARGDAADR